MTGRDESMLQLRKVVEDVCNVCEAGERGIGLHSPHRRGGGTVSGTISSNIELDDLAERTRKIFKGSVIDADRLKQLQDMFSRVDCAIIESDESKEFEFIEAFIISEQNQGRKRRDQTRKTVASEERRIEAEVAELKALRFKTKLQKTQEELQDKIADTERSYLCRRCQEPELLLVFCLLLRNTLSQKIPD